MGSTFRFRGVDFKDAFVEGIGIYRKGTKLLLIKDDLSEVAIQTGTSTISTRIVDENNPTLAFVGDILKTQVVDETEYFREDFTSRFDLISYADRFSVAVPYGQKVPDIFKGLHKPANYKLRARTFQGKWLSVVGVREVNGGTLVLDELTENWVGVIPETLSQEIEGTYRGDIVQLDGTLGKFFYVNQGDSCMPGVVVGNKWDNPELLKYCRSSH